MTRTRYRNLPVGFYQSDEVRGLSALCVLIYTHLWLHPSMTQMGCMRATAEGLEAEMRGSLKGLPEGFLKGFREGFQEGLRGGLWVYDPEACFIGLPHFVKINRPPNPNVVKGWHRLLTYIPTCDTQVAYFQHVDRVLKGLPKGFQEGLPKGFVKGFGGLSLRSEIRDQRSEEEKTQTPQKESVKPPAAGGPASPAPLELSEESAPGAPKSGDRVSAQDIDSVFDAHDLGIRGLRTIEGKPARLHGRQAVRKTVAAAVKQNGAHTARLAARNIVLSGWHRGNGNLGLVYALRSTMVDKLADLCTGSDAEFAKMLEREVNPPVAAGRKNAITDVERSHRNRKIVSSGDAFRLEDL